MAEWKLLRLWKLSHGGATRADFDRGGHFLLMLEILVVKLRLYLKAIYNGRKSKHKSYGYTIYMENSDLIMSKNVSQVWARYGHISNSCLWFGHF